MAFPLWIAVGLSLAAAQEIDVTAFKFDRTQSAQNSVPGSAVAAAPQAVFSFPEHLVRGAPARKYQPEAFEYRKNGSALAFVAAVHGEESTRELVRQYFKGAGEPKAAPKAVVIEMEPTRPDSHCDGEAAKSEACVAKNLAQPKNKPPRAEVIFGEYAPPELLSAIVRRKKYGVRDYEGFWLLRTMTGNGNRAEKEFKRSEFDKMFTKLSEEFLEEYNSKENDISDSVFKTKEEFEEWYRKGNGKEPGYLRRNFQNHELEKEAWQAGDLRSQQVLLEALIVRDLHLGAVIAQALNEHRSVLVVYGAWHYDDLKDALAKMLGEPKR